MELFIVILQILSLVIDRNSDIKFKELKRHFIESLIQKISRDDDNNMIRKNLAQKSLSILISCDIFIIGAANDDAYIRKFKFGDENEADVESDAQGTYIY